MDDIPPWAVVGRVAGDLLRRRRERRGVLLHEMAGADGQWGLADVQRIEAAAALDSETVLRYISALDTIAKGE